ncbi:MAG TPA: OPT/YSL family transporter, partial [Terriglobales bacterium]|nr:OPT/YSL family transporter [Terriglobales bacterium]
IQWIQGIGSAKAPAPQARLMATVISGILNQRLPWGLVMLGVFLVVGVELLGIRSLSFAVGFYISIATTCAMFIGGMMRWLVERSAQKRGQATQESEVSPGSLYASGLIAAGGIVGLVGIVVKLIESKHWIREGAVAWGTKLPWMANGGTPGGHWFAVVMFALLAASAYYFARKPLDTTPHK